jgi:hypothetical protein
MFPVMGSHATQIGQRVGPIPLLGQAFRGIHFTWIAKIGAAGVLNPVHQTPELLSKLSENYGGRIDLPHH